MAVIQAENLGDLVAGTLHHLGRNNYQQIAQNYRSYPWFEAMFRREKTLLDSGYGIQRSIMNRIPDSAAHVGLGEPDSVAIVDLMDQLQVPWVHARTSWAVIYEETLMNRDEALIFNIIKPRREGSAIALIEAIESRAWQAPASSSDKKNPFGVPYYVVKNATTGFNGGAATGHTTVAGVSLTDSPTYKNYTTTWTLANGHTKAESVKNIRLGMAKCGFRSPVPGSDYSKGLGRYKVHTNLEGTEQMRTIGESQNENIGRDIANRDYAPGRLMFNGYDVEEQPQLEADTSNPVYWLDMSTWFVYGLRGNWFREVRNTAPHQHDIEQHFQQLSYNYVNVDRRRSGVAYGV